jgi:hypothetical protein
MKRLLAAFALAVCAHAQEAGIEQRIVELKNFGPGFLQDFLRPYGVSVRQSPNPRFVGLSGPKASVAAAEQALKSIDVAPSDVEVTFQIISASAQPGGHEVPVELQRVVDQLRNAFHFPHYQLVETLIVRTRELNNGEASSVMETKDAGMAVFNVRFRPSAVISDAKGKLIRIDNLKFGARIPYVNVPQGHSVEPLVKQIQYIETGITADIDVREGQKVVVGRSNFNGKEGAFFLIVTAKVVD